VAYACNWSLDHLAVRIKSDLYHVVGESKYHTICSERALRKECWSVQL